MIVLDIGLWGIVGISIAAFLGIILVLVGMLLFARKKLTPQGKVKITINDEKVIETEPGGTLLSTFPTTGFTSFCLWRWRHLWYVPGQSA